MYCPVLKSSTFPPGVNQFAINNNNNNNNNAYLPEALNYSPFRKKRKTEVVFDATPTEGDSDDNSEEISN
jgi:hypothetical protein